MTADEGPRPANHGQSPQVTLYTDGACLGNPGPGGYAVILLCDKHRKQLSGGVRLTTNNRMEIMAAIAGLEALKTPCAVTLHSDSKYLVDAMTQGWVRRWRANGWVRKRKGRGRGEPALNTDLWQRLLDLCETHEVEFRWLRGHVGNRENERADQLAVQAAQRPNLPPDAAYEEGQADPRPPDLFGCEA